jgi:Flp pilus assembly protein TadG
MIRQIIRRFLVGEDGVAGTALLEFTIFAPVLVVISIYTMDFSLGFYAKMQVQNAAQAGIDWALANHVANATDIHAAVITATNPAVTDTSDYPNTLGLNQNFGPKCGCPASTGVTFTAWTSPNPCPTCTTLSGTETGGLYITVQTQTPYTPFFSYGLFSSGNRTLTAQVTARIQ